LDHREVSLIRTKLKLPKETIFRCFELLLLAFLDPNDSKVHEAYRRNVLKRFAECRELLKPYFRFENFADRSMYTINDLGEQDAKLREKCCIGNGQLACLLNNRRNSLQDDRKTYSEVIMTQSSPLASTSMHHVAPSSENGADCSNLLPFAKISNTYLQQREDFSNREGYPASMTPTQTQRTNRFAPAPWHEVYGS
jgi:hypothetical protein